MPGTMPGERAFSPQVIFGADDFGRSSEINRAVIRAHREGVLTSTSLMVGAEAADEAAVLASKTPSLAVGLHVVVVDGRAVLPHCRIPQLVDRDGYFRPSPVTAGLIYAFDSEARRQLAMEIRAQFERFAAYGLRLSHVDCHLQMHVHPVVLKLLIPLMTEFGVSGLRIPRDELLISLHHSRKNLVPRVMRTLVMRMFSRYCIRRLGSKKIHYTDFVYGIAQSGCMEEPYVADVLKHLKQPSAEFIFHPTTGAALDPLGPNPGDFAVLLSPRIRALVEQRRLRLTSYPFLLDHPSQENR